LDCQRAQTLFGHDGRMTAELLADLEWRGLIAQTTDLKALKEQLESGSTAFYIGFDPTAPSLHLGNLVVLLVMRRFQLAGAPLQAPHQIDYLKSCEKRL